MKKNFSAEKTLRHGVRATVATGVGAAAVVAGMHISHGGPAEPSSSEHSLSYLNNDEMETGIRVTYGDTPEGIAQTVNGNRLKGQALIDAENFVMHQGKITETGSNGFKQYDLYSGQVVEAPVMTDQQIADVNSGKIG